MMYYTVADDYDVGTAAAAAAAEAAAVCVCSDHSDRLMAYTY